LNHRPIIFLIFFCLLSGCAPTNYVYVKKFSHNVPTIGNVMIVVEYLDIKNDIKGYWNFEETTNLQNQDVLYEIASNMLLIKGYTLADMSLKTSGLIIDRSFLVDHFINKQKQEVAIAPPFIVRSIDLDDENIQGLESLLAELNQPMSAVMSDLRGYVKNNYLQQMQALDMPSDTVILIIQSYKPRVSPFANMGITFASSTSGTGTYVDVNRRVLATTYAYLLHKGTGDLLWSNKTTVINSKNQEKFFAQVPIK